MWKICSYQLFLRLINIQHLHNEGGYIVYFVLNMKPGYHDETAIPKFFHEVVFFTNYLKLTIIYWILRRGPSSS